MSAIPEDLSLELPVLDAPHSLQERRTSAAAEKQVIELFEQFRSNILHYLCCLGLPMADGEEISQEVFLLLHQHLHRQKSRSNLRGWLFRVSHNLGLKRRMVLQAQNKSAVGGDAGLAERHPASEPTPEEQFFFQERQKRLLAVVDVLPAQDRHCLYLRGEGLRYREIAEVLDISLGSVAKSLSRTLQKLAKAEERWNGASES